MAKDIIEQVETHIREILRLCGVLNADGGELHKLNDLEPTHTAAVEREQTQPCAVNRIRLSAVLSECRLLHSSADSCRRT